MKWATPHNSRFDYLATANMQGGSNIYQLDLSDLSNINVINNVYFTDEKDNQLLYGLDVLGHRVVSSGNKEEEEELGFSMSTCSFYESKTYFWTANMPFQTVNK